MKKLVALACLAWLAVDPVAADPWDFRREELSAGLASEAKMPDEDEYEGSKLFVSGRLLLDAEQSGISERRQCCVLPSRPTLMLGLLEGAAHVGLEGSGIEYLAGEAVPWGMVWEPGEPKQQGWRAAADLLQLGVVRYIEDEPLEVDDYIELAVARAGRLLEFTPTAQSPHHLAFGFVAATGWAWANTEIVGYSDVSNPWAGVYFDLSYDHDRLGGLYLTSRFINGFSFSNPSRGHPTVREALVGAGYRRELSDQLAFRLYWEKRSFYFDEGGLPTLYTWTRTYAAELAFRFSG